MTCREFTKQTEGLTLAELVRSADQALLGHERECSSCASWLQQQRLLAGALQALRSSTATLEAGTNAEHAVLRAFRQSSVRSSAEEIRPFGFRLGRFFAWRVYAAAAAALAISVGLGTWFWLHSGSHGKQLTQQKAAAEQPLVNVPQTAQTVNVQQSPSTAPSEVAQVREPVSTSVSRVATTTSASSSQLLAQVAQAQGYVPLMLCDPLSCSGDEQVVRMELPANAVDPSRDSSEPLVADVILGDDGLVRAIRLVQQ